MPKTINKEKLDRIVADARRQATERMQGYREQSLRIHPWVCGRCGREFNQKNIRELTVHHKDHNHDNNPPDGSNWENLCLYCHDREHQKHTDFIRGEHANYNVTFTEPEPATHKPFAALKNLLEKE